ncbi:cell wall-binding repeat-containing protein [Clostridium sp. A1-XYC3]|uniref:Cell wall-binding repeat-containing protein n=1 Tax=Clostridium tanneri TaxID=3037988 RepID=A0ABU4JNG0_9CLOT|nr:cell wall-binding repeat-containing protein [Clostridium sp. A1-XYC3]MDW8799670.1 cell wall-binding repeat-containing protein [Clostridium sp. A1-XYC3]
MNKSIFIGVLKSKRLALIVAAVAVSSTLNAAKVQAAPEVNRYNGMDRYETAAKVCNDGWNMDTDYAVIVNGENFPDALSAAPLAKKYNAPILLTEAEVLNHYTSAELTRLNVKNVFIIGGKGVVSQSIEDALKARKIKVTRLGGADRYETALQVAAKVGKTGEVAIINGNDFRDGMTIASIAAAKGMPIVLTEKNHMPDSVKKYLGNTSKMAQVYVVGDENTISEEAIKGLSNVKRVGYGNAYEKNTSIIDAFQNELDTDTLYVASAKDFPDSLAASALAPRTASPVLFVDSPMDASTQRFLKKHIVNKLKVLGGPGSVSYDAEQIAKGLPLGIGKAENITDTIWQNEKYTPPATMIITATDGNKKEVSVDWNLTKINTTKPGIYTFTGKVKGSDKTVFTTLTVKPIPYKIDDITKTAKSRESFELPSTVTAQMSDGTKVPVPVTWDYGTQNGSKGGVYTFNGTVDKYNKKVKLTLTITPKAAIASIEDFKKVFETSQDMYSFIRSKMPKEATALMDDGNESTVDITWEPVSKLTNGSAAGTHILRGTVPDYANKVKFLMIVKSEGGVDPNPSNPGNGSGDTGTNPNNPNNPEDPDDTVKDLGELPAIVQGQAYPDTVKDPVTGRQVQVTWTKVINIDTTFVNEDKLEDCRISKVTLEGTIGNSNNKVKATIGVIPRILGITTSSNTSNTLTPVVIPISGTGVYDMETATEQLRAIIIDPRTGERIKKEVTVLIWDPPYISVGDSQNYNVRAAIKYYINSNNTNTIDVTLQVQQTQN